MNPHALVQHLPVAAASRPFHHQVLGHHERQLAFDVRRDHLFVHDDAADDVVVDQRERIGGEERFRNRDAAVRGVVERSLEPLRRRRERRIQRVDDEVPRQRIHPLGAHRVALVRHRGRTDLLLFERLLDLAQMLQQPHVVRELRRRLREAAERRDDMRVDLPRIRLARHWIAARESDFLRHELFEPVHFLFIAVEEIEERGLGAGRAFDAEE
jgi:hypothetical protein